MHWSYRIVHYKEGGFGLHEVFFEGEKVEYWTKEPEAFRCDEEEGPQGLIEDLRKALEDAQMRPVLEEKRERRGKSERQLS